MDVAPQVLSTDFGLAWNWEHDHDFVQRLDQACFQAGLSCYLVGPHNIQTTCREVQQNARRFRWFLDRASDEDDRFLQLNRLLESSGARFLNTHHHQHHAADKANLHGPLAARGLHLPQTVVLPPYDSAPEFDRRLVDWIAKPFVIKPARGGGGRGVLVGATRAEDIVQTRIRLRQQRVLVQQRIEPEIIAGRRAWFRVYFVCGETIACWWDDHTHRYAALTAADETLVDKAELARIARSIAEVAQLDFFSTEIALDRNGRYVAIDYVNDPCDMRSQSRCDDGVPDAVIGQIISVIVAHVANQLNPPAPAPPA